MNISLFGRTLVITTYIIHPFDLLWAPLQLEVANPAGRPTSGTSALEKNNSGIPVQLSDTRSKLADMHRANGTADGIQQCAASVRSRAERRSGSIDRSGSGLPVVTLLIDHWCSVEQFRSLASAAPIERTSAPEKGSSTGIRTIERKPKMRCSNLYVHDGTWQVGICAKTAERRGRLVIPVAGLASSPVLSVL